MNAKKLYYALISLTVMIIIATAGVLYVADSFLKKNSEKLTEYKKEEKQVQLDERVYLKATNDLKKFNQLGLREVVNEALPKEKDQARAIKEIFQMAESSNINIDKIQFADSTLGEKPKNATPSTTSGGNNQPASSSITQAKPIAGISGVQGIEMSVGISSINDKIPIDYNRFIDFVNKITNSRRTMQITKLSIQPGLKKAEITINIFVKS